MIFSITNDQFNLGNVFLIWSLHYLSGGDDYYDVRIDARRSIPSNPLLKGITAHKMEPNFVRTIENFNEVVDLMPNDDTVNHVKFNIKARSLEQHHATNHELQELSASKGIRCVNLTCSDHQHLVGFLRHDIEVPQWQKDIAMVKSHCEHYWPNFFDNASIFEDNLEKWHGIRENIAFNIRLDDFWTHFPARPENNFIYHCQYSRWVADGQNEIRNVMNFLGLECREDRMDAWRDLHETWKNSHAHYLDFCDDIEQIVDCIVKNKSMDLTKYRLDVLKEAVILHLLLYKHDLNLKMPVEQLPLDTKQIAAMLQQNQRSGLEKLYQD